MWASSGGHFAVVAQLLEIDPSTSLSCYLPFRVRRKRFHQREMYPPPASRFFPDGCLSYTPMMGRNRHPMGTSGHRPRALLSPIQIPWEVATASLFFGQAMPHTHQPISIGSWSRVAVANKSRVPDRLEAGKYPLTSVDRPLRPVHRQMNSVPLVHVSRLGLSVQFGPDHL